MESGHWGYGINIYGKPRRYRSQAGETPTLNSAIYGFESDEEYMRVQAYIKTHGGYKLEVVSIWVRIGSHCSSSHLLFFKSILLVTFTISYTLTISLVFSFLFSGRGKWELYVLYHQEISWDLAQEPEGPPIQSYMVFSMTGGSVAGTE